MSRRLPFLALLLLSACALTVPGPAEDPQARRETGRIVGKRPLADGLRDLPRRHIPITVGDRVILLDIASSDPPALPSAHAYTVGLADGRQVQVFGAYPGYRLGDCVKVLLSDNPAYPRFDLGGRCPQ